MSELNLSADAKRRLWRCYSLLLRLANEAEKNTAADSELCDGHESATVTEANELTRLDNDTPKTGLGQIEVVEQAEQQVRDVQFPGRARQNSPGERETHTGPKIQKAFETT